MRVLTDPMFSERASPFWFVGPKRFFPPPLPLDSLPDIDAVVISHDHYDHLDMASVRALGAKGARFVVPLGIGARLEGWGIPLVQITELEWWESTTVGALTITSTPSRHFSGRWLDDADATLWSGWAIASPTHRVYYSGDTALLPEMEEIGTRLGPFDVAMIEIGEYDALWTDVHLGPEQAVRVSRLVRAGTMLPVHWATFDLALHGWTEPIERTLVAAGAEGVRVATPVPGEMVEPARGLPSPRWWPNVEWKTVQEHPAFSTSVGELWERTAPTPH
jgi:L-ascorbate metabolism protein UlaG (beta-lactamase superfamily)